MFIILSRICLLCLLSGLLTLTGSPEIPYRTPSEVVTSLVRKPLLPVYRPSPTKNYLVRLELPGLQPMDRLAREEIRLAGFNVFADTRCRSRMVYAHGISLVKVGTGIERPVEGLPDERVIVAIQWSPDGQHVALLLEEERQVSLWRLDITEMRAEKWSELPVHAGMEQMLDWASDSRSVWLRTVPTSLGPRPDPETIPTGVVVRQTEAEKQPVQTHQGLLKTRLDVETFEYFFTSQITRVYLDGSHSFLGEPGVYRSFSDSPDLNYLLVEVLTKPWSYLVTEDLFALDVEVWDWNQSTHQVLASAPAAENMPYGKGNIRLGARDFEWKSNEPATVVWVEAQDGGNPYRAAKLRDSVYQSKAPFEEAPEVVLELKDRFGDLLWHESGPDILVTWDWIGREVRLSSLKLIKGAIQPKRLLRFEMGDRYRHPGFPLLVFNENGFPVLETDASGKHIFLVGEGGSPDGDRPFMHRFNLENRKKKRLFRSTKPFYEFPIALLDENGDHLLVQRESQSMPPTLYQWDVAKKEGKRVTSDANPYPELQGVQRKLLRYKRSDGIRLTANLYLPSGYNSKRDGPLPTLVWAYPRVYQSAENAGQLKKSPYLFMRARWHRPSLWVLRGYAVLDDPSMPIVAGEGSNANDSFIPQLVDSARAAVRELIRRGISERGKIALGGHSYGAFMTANLLAHTDLFCAGIARNGAYNRTLTPFGFQSEERNLWQAPMVYLEMSPFLNAGKIDEPLLLIHGMEDYNSGTFPIQSERLYHAINGLGGEARLVLLPEEGHSIRTEESALHMLWEMENWLETHVGGPLSRNDHSVARKTTPRAGARSSTDGGENEEP